MFKSLWLVNLTSIKVIFETHEGGKRKTVFYEQGLVALHTKSPYYTRFANFFVDSTFIPETSYKEHHSLDIHG